LLAALSFSFEEMVRKESVTAVSVPGAVATGSGGTLEIERDFLIRSLPLPVLTHLPCLD
jgi:hypothetical protein